MPRRYHPAVAFTTVSLAALLLASCVGAEARRDTRDAYQHASNLADTDGNIAKVIQAKISDRADFGTRAERDRHGVPFPPQWESPGVTLARNPGRVGGVSMSLTAFVAELRRALQVPVTLDLAPPQAMFGNQNGLAQIEGTRPVLAAVPGQGAPQEAFPRLSSSVAALDPTSNDPVQRLIDQANRQQQQGGPQSLAGGSFPITGPSPSAGLAGFDPNSCVINFPEGTMPLSRRLLFVDSSCGVRSTYDGQKIVIRRYVEEFMPVAAFSGSQTFQSLNGTSSTTTGGSNGGMSNGNGGAANGGGGNNGANGANGNGGAANSSLTGSAEWKNNVFDEVVQGVKARVPRDALVMASDTQNGVTVVAPPEALDRARLYVEDFNRTKSRLVSLKFEVLETTLTDGLNFGTDVTLAIKDRWSKLNFSGSGVPSGLSDSTAGCISAGVPTSGFANAVKDIAGTSVTACMLATEGHAKIVFSRTFLVGNGDTFAFDESTLNDYVCGGSAASSTNAGTVVNGAIQTCTTFAGTKALVKPVILADGLIRLRVQPDLQGAPQFTSAGGAADFVNLRRNQAVRRFTPQDLSVQNGGTVVAYAARADNVTADDAGFGSARLPLFGGHNSSSKTQSVFVILLTPTERDALGRAPTL